jgi:hypothetical protein
MGNIDEAGNMSSIPITGQLDVIELCLCLQWRPQLEPPSWDIQEYQDTVSWQINCTSKKGQKDYLERNEDM